MTGRRTDGYHELDSLVTFAAWGDRLTFAPERQLTLELSAGPSPRRSQNSTIWCCGRRVGWRIAPAVRRMSGSRWTSASPSPRGSAAARPMPPRPCAGCAGSGSSSCRPPTCSRSLSSSAPTCRSVLPGSAGAHARHRRAVRADRAARAGSGSGQPEPSRADRSGVRGVAPSQRADPMGRCPPTARACWRGCACAAMIWRRRRAPRAGDR